MKRNLFKKGILVTALMFVCINTSLAENKTEDSKSLSFNIVKQVKDILNVSENPDASSSATTTSTSTYAVLATSTPYFCEAQNKINIKKEKVNKQIKNQIQDKNRLIESMISVSASSSEDLKNIIDENVLRLEEYVSEIIKDEKNLLIYLASSSEISCDTQNKINKKEFEKSLAKIKKAESEIAKKSNYINTLIKVNIKNILKDVE